MASGKDGAKAEERSLKVADERFWLTRGTEIVEESAEKLDQGAQRLASAMAWFWTVYSTAAAATFVAAATTVTVAQAVLTVSPALALFVAYAVATWASLPVPIQFNVLAPYEIKAAHEAAVATKRQRLRVSLAFATLAAMLVSLVVLGLSVRGQPSDRAMAIAVASTAAGADVVVAGAAPNTGPLLVRVTPKGTATESRMVEARKDESFVVAVPVARADTYAVEVSWRSGERTTVLSETVKGP